MLLTGTNVRIPMNTRNLVHYSADTTTAARHHHSAPDTSIASSLDGLCPSRHHPRACVARGALGLRRGCTERGGAGLRHQAAPALGGRVSAGGQRCAHRQGAALSAAANGEQRVLGLQEGDRLREPAPPLLLPLALSVRRGSRQLRGPPHGASNSGPRASPSTLGKAGPVRLSHLPASHVPPPC